MVFKLVDNLITIIMHKLILIILQIANKKNIKRDKTAVRQSCLRTVETPRLLKPRRVSTV